MSNFTGASKNRTSKPQTTRSAAKRVVGNHDVVISPLRTAQARVGNHGFRGGSSTPGGGI